MQIVAAIVLAAVVFIAANRYVSRFGLLWWVAHTFVFALAAARNRAGRNAGSGCVGLSS